VGAGRQRRVRAGRPGIDRAGGQLTLPKLFRRATDHLRARDGGFQGNLADWLLQANRTIRFQADLLDVVFVEK
jgi:hypothetical protein